MKTWFTIEKIDNKTHIISEYRHWEETHCYLIEGKTKALLIDTGLGICNISNEIAKLTTKPITVIATHIHWDHIGGHKYYKDFYCHKDELSWLQGKFPLTLDTIKEMVVDKCDLPDNYDINSYEFFQGTPTKLLYGNEIIDLGDRKIEIIHTPGHSPGHMCFYERNTGYLFTGDLIYIGTLFAYFPSTDPILYKNSLEKLSSLTVNKVFPAHHTLNIESNIINEMLTAFTKLDNEYKLIHGSGVFDFNNFKIWL